MSFASNQALSARPPSGRPARKTLAWLVGLVLVMHLVFFLGMSGLLEVQLFTPDAARVNPLQTRMLTPVVPVAPVVTTPKPAAPRTRIAKEAEPPPAAPLPQTPLVQAPTPEASGPEKEASSAVASADAPQVPASDAGTATTTGSSTTPAPEAPPVVSAATEPAPTEVLPNIPLGALPPSMLLSYNLSGMEKGITYSASGELNWQHNDQAYALALSVKAFLLGSRHWRSQGLITAAGLEPSKFTDSWRGERASHFDRENKQVVFSSNAPTAQLQPGAQDQISLYAQLAAAMAGSAQQFKPGTRLQIQTATVRDAVPWLLTLDQIETLTVDGKSVQATKWVCQPRNRFDAKVEFWVSPKHGWLPVRIRITQVSGSYIDLLMTGQKLLPALPTSTPAG